VEILERVVGLVGLSLGAILVAFGFASAITMNLHKEGFLALKNTEIERSVDDIVAARYDALPQEMSYVARAGRIVHRQVDLASRVRGEAQAWEGAWRFRRFEPLVAERYFVIRPLDVAGVDGEIGYRYLLYREHMHRMAEPLLYIMLAAVALVAIGFPWFFETSVFGPLRRLLGGVDRMEKGTLDVDVPVGVRDEIGVLTQSFNSMVESVRESREKLRAAYEHQIDLTEAYSRFVPKEILTTLNKRTILDLGLGDNVQREMTVLFSDIRSFTTISESMSPEQVFRFINEYLEQVGPVVRRQGGYIDKYIGDAVMALFPGGADDALATAIEMHEQVRTFNRERAAGRADHVEIQIGIGIHTGDLMLGTIGEHQRMEGTVISDAVNLASRIEGLTKLYDARILISDDTYEKLAHPEVYCTRHLDRVRVKGKSAWVDIVEVLDGKDEARRTSKLVARGDFDAAVAAFKSRRFSEAREQFESLRRRNPADVAIGVYLERFIEQGIPEDWDGAFGLPEK